MDTPTDEKALPSHEKDSLEMPDAEALTTREKRHGEKSISLKIAILLGVSELSN